VALCAKLEAELADLTEDEAKKYLQEYGLERSGLDELILSTYKLLDLITFFTCQNQILQAWTVARGTKTPQAAGKVHTDFEKNFIRAEVINWSDLVKLGSEQIARDKGTLRTEGRDYVVQDGEVIHFRVGG
jgi:ribosome-binding ATPase YchF (GTP1/OBG family)